MKQERLEKEKKERNDSTSKDRLIVYRLPNNIDELDKLHIFQVESDIFLDETFIDMPNSLKFRKHDDFFYCKSKTMNLWMIYYPGFWMFDKWIPNVEDTKLGAKRMFDPEADVIVFTKRINKLKEGRLEIYFESEDTNIFMMMNYDIKNFITPELIEKLQGLKQKYSYSLKFIV